MKTPDIITDFLSGKRFAVAGVSRNPQKLGNALMRRLRESGYEVVPLNPHASTLEGVPCYPDLAAVPGEIDGLVVATSPGATLTLVEQCAKRGVKRIWFHRGIGKMSASDEAIERARSLGVKCIAGGCPFMYCGRVDPFHKCLRAWTQWVRPLE